jgi:hypothetical protein
MEKSASDERLFLENALKKGEKWRKSIENEKIPLTREAVSLKIVTICNNQETDGLRRNGALFGSLEELPYEDESNPRTWRGKAACRLFLGGGHDRLHRRVRLCHYPGGY